MRRTLPFGPGHCIKALVLSLCLLALQSEPLHGGDVLLDENIRVTHFEQMSYPLLARLAGSKGAVVVRVSLSKNGAVTSATPLSGPKGLIDDCVKNAAKWEFDASKSSEAIVVYVFQVTGLCYQCQGSSVFYPPNLLVVSTGEPIVSR